MGPRSGPWRLARKRRARHRSRTRCHRAAERGSAEPRSATMKVRRRALAWSLYQCTQDTHTSGLRSE
eukprot:7255431-Alexandrium_andersonii.AAC.2